MSVVNRLIKAYLSHWDKELEEIKSNAPGVQQDQLSQIGQAKVFRLLNPEIELRAPNDLNGVSLSSYEDIKSQVIQIMDQSASKYYARSAGTSSGEHKLIPTPDYFVRLNHLRGSWYVLHTLYHHRPDMSVFKAQNLLLGGSIYARETKYTIGDVSGIMLSRIPWYMQPWYCPNIKTAISPDWEEKIELTAQEAAKTSQYAIRYLAWSRGLHTWWCQLCTIQVTICRVDHRSKL